uniref:PET hydrolase/cutinase-like domain-containing protein n=1 Tax=Alexandrium monilatum TaxID=311494 RepID=A0A7S4Q9T4_9DINO
MAASALLALVAGTLLLGAAGVAPRRLAKPTKASTQKLRELNDPKTFEALVYEPPGEGALWPLLLYLHGAGESGGALVEILSEGATGTPPVALSQGKAIPGLAERFVVVAPHAHRGWQPQAVSRFLDFLLSAESKLSLDPSRLYVTGHSMGGYGALAAAASTRRFAAVVPVAPSGAPSAASLAGVPLWAFHGRNDVIVPSSYSEDLVEELWRKGASREEVRLTLYEKAPAPFGWPTYYGHASTIPAYATPELYDWLLAQRLTGAAPAAAPEPRELAKGGGE